MSIVRKLWARAKETPDERRIRKRHQGRTPTPQHPESKTKRGPIEPEHFEFGLTDGRVIRW